MELLNSKGYNKIIVCDGCDQSLFYQLADKLEEKLKVVFLDRVQDFGSLFWDFRYEQSVMTLHYNNYLGISISPSQYENASEVDNNLIRNLFEKLKIM